MAKTEEAKENAKKKTTTSAKKTAAPKRKVVEEQKDVKEEVVAKKESKKSNKFGGIIGLLLVVALVALFVVSLNESGERSKYLKEISYNDFTEIIKSEEPTVIYWASPTCSYCKQFKPVVLNVTYDNKLTFNYLNTRKLTNDQDAAIRTYLIEYDQTYSSNVLGTPSIIVFKDSKIVGLSVGALSESELINFLQKQGLIK